MNGRRVEYEVTTPGGEVKSTPSRCPAAPTTSAPRAALCSPQPCNDSLA